MEGASRFLLDRLRDVLKSPIVLFGQGVTLGQDALRKTVKCAVKKGGEEEEVTEAVYDAAVLLACLWYHKWSEDDSDGQDNETVTFSCNEQDEDIGGKRALHLVAENGGPASLFSLLTLAGADVNAEDRVSALRDREGVGVGEGRGGEGGGVGRGFIFPDSYHPESCTT